MKNKLNILVLLVIVWSLFPVNVGASSEVKIPISGQGYFGKSSNPVVSEHFVSEPYEYVMANGYYKIGNSRYAPGDEVVERATENSETTYLGEGTGGAKFGLSVSIGPVHYKDNYTSTSESWKNIDLTMTKGVVDKAPYILTVDGLKVTVKDKKTGSVVELSLSEVGETDTLKGTTATKIAVPTYTVSVGKAVKSNIATDTDLEITWDNTRINYSRILKSSSAPVKAKYNISQTGTDLTVNTKAVDTEKEVAVVSSVKDGILTESIDSKTSLSYPVKIDPTITVKPGAAADTRFSGVGSSAGSVSDGCDAGILYFNDSLYTHFSAGIRYSNLTIMSGATIDTAHITFTSNGNFALTPINTRFYAEQNTTAAQFGTGASGYTDFWARTRTTNYVDWDIGDTWSSGTTYDSPELETVIQELVNDYSGLSGANIVIFWQDDDSTHGGLYARYAYDYATSSTKVPELYISYTEPTAPTVETHSPATSITTTTAIVEGHVTADGGASVTDRGICWNTGGSPTTADSHAHNGTGTGTFTGSLSSLSSGTTYHTKAFATNSVSTSYGSEVDFLTLPAAPTNVSATEITGANNVTVTWTKSTGATDYVVTRNSTDITGWLGDVATYTDSTAGAPSITVGTAAATDGTSTQNVTLSISGESAVNGLTYSYTVKAKNATGNSSASSADTGYRGVGSLTYQWAVSSADASPGLWNITGGTTDPYIYASAPSPTITAGAASAADGTSATVVALSVSGESGNNGAGRYYLCTLSATGATTSNTSSDRGYTGTTTLTYQWYRSAADSDAGYGAIGGATTDPYNDVGGVTAPDGRYYKAAIAMVGASTANTTADRGYLSTPPIVSTVLATSVEETTATSGANITNLNGGPNCTEVGVDYGKTSGSYVSNTHSHGDYGVGAQTINLSSLTQGSLYYYRGYASGTWGAGYGGEQSFLTKPESPTGFSATTVNSSAISYSWVKGTGAGYTYIRYKAGSYPADITDGTESYNGTGTSNTQGSLADATNYYFRAWSWTSNTTLSQYSDLYDEDYDLTSNPPSLTTTAPSSVEETTATTGGNITYSPKDVSVWGVQYGTSTGVYPNWQNTSSNPGVPYAFSKNLLGLVEGTTYYYRAFAVNIIGAGYGSEDTLLTKPLSPTSFSCTTVNSTAIALNWTKGTGATYTYIRYQTLSYPLNPTDGSEAYNGTGITWVQSGLSDVTRYYFTAWSWTSDAAESKYSDSTGNCNSLTGDEPTVTTGGTSSVTATQLVASGNATAGSGNIERVGIEYGSTTAYGSYVDSTAGLPAPAPQAFSLTITPLSPGTYYYYRAFADNYVGTGYGTMGYVLTLPQPPSVFSAAFVNTTAIQLSWTAGTGADRTIVRGSNTTYPTTITDGSLVANTTSATATHGGFTSLVTYYYSAWSETSENTSVQYSSTYLSDSEIVPSGLPNVYTNVSTGYGPNWATVAGLVANTYPNPTIFGFQYGPTNSYGSWQNTTAVVGGIFSSTITGLTPGASYHYRAFAVNSYGVGYGSDMEFFTGGTATLYESYTYGCNTTWNQNYESFTTQDGNWTSIQGQYWIAQTFNATSSHSINQVVIWAKRTTTVAEGYIYVGIRDEDTDTPHNPDLGLGLYAINYVSLDGGPIEVSLENEIQIESGHRYAITVRAPAADGTDNVSILTNFSGGFTFGNGVHSDDGGATWAVNTWDMDFVIIGRQQPIYGNVEAAQTFLVGATPHTTQRFRLILGRVGQPGNIYVSLRNYDGGVLSTADLAIVALNGNAITLDKAMYDCVLVPEKSIEANKNYAIVVTAPSGDRYNYVLWCMDTSGGYASGTALISEDAGLSWATSTGDYMFEVWGNSVINVVNAKVFKNYLATGDWLITTEVLNITPPYYENNEDPSSYHIISFMGLTGTTYASTPCERWAKSPVSIYLNPTQASALTWGGLYKVRIGNIAGTMYSEYALVSSDWNASSLTYLDNWARLCAKDMETYDTTRTGTATTYLTYVADKGYVLNQDGGAIFNQACPRLSYVRPNLFQVTNNRPEMDNTPVATPGTEFTYEERLGSYLSGLLDQGAGAMGIGDTKSAGGIIVVGIYFLIAFGTVVKGFAWAGMIAAFPVILIGMYYGLLDVGLILVILAVMVVLFVREFFFKGG